MCLSHCCARVNAVLVICIEAFDNSKEDEDESENTRLAMTQMSNVSGRLTIATEVLCLEELGLAMDNGRTRAIYSAKEGKTGCFANKGGR